MRNWNPVQLRESPRSSSLRAYLWGIETQDTQEAHFIVIKIASLPMRNWNVANLFFCGASVLNCEPTYEELKRSKYSW